MARVADVTASEFMKSANYKIVKSKRELAKLLHGINEAALDFETTGLDPDDGAKVRLTSICNDAVHFIIDHFMLGPLEDWAEQMSQKVWWVYNAKFEYKFLDHAGIDCVLNDVDFAKKAKMGGGHSSLLVMAKDVGISLSKDQQNSDWSALNLSEQQLDYAAFDSYVTWKIKKHWWDNELTTEQKKAFHVFNDAVPATVECEDTGLHLNVEVHEKLIKVWKKKHTTFENYLDRFTPPPIITNYRSKKQLSEFLKKELPRELIDVWPKTEKTKQLQIKSKHLKSVARRVSYPLNRWLAALAGLQYWDKYLSTYGDTLLTKQKLSGRITSRFNIGQAVTGRYSSSSSNLQNIPRNPIIRRAFYAPGWGIYETMALADYSGIEVRVLAELSGDKQLLHDVIYGDVHAASAAQIYNMDLDEVVEVLKKKEGKQYSLIKERRSIAKGFTFQLTYGAGAGALSDVLASTFDEAVKAIDKWAERYPLAYDYRNKMYKSMVDSGGYLPVVDGRTIFVPRYDRSLPVAANYPIQGAAASVMLRAVHYVKKRFDKANLEARLAASVHDEILSYTTRKDADRAMAEQIKGMTDGWLYVFPNTSTDNLIEWAIGDTWAAKP